MSNWMTIYDGVFFISIGTILAGSFGLAVKYCLKSKCERFSVCFGLFEIQRRVDLEVQEEMAQIEMGGLIDDTKQEDNKSPKTPTLQIPKFKRNHKENNLEQKEDI